MALIIEAPNEIYSLENNENWKLFLAGGITNCPDWQAILLEDIKELPNLTIYNPRRKNFPIGDPKAAEAQITWEFIHLLNADIILFWFAQGSLNPIVLFELGRYGLSSDRPIIIGVDPQYERKQDVVIQTKLSRPDIEIADSLEEMSEALFIVMNTLSQCQR
jgi:hypothetical protein